MTVYGDILQSVGNNPVVKIANPSKGVEILAKLEMFNPGRSVKDRIAVAMIDAAEKEGRLKPGGTIIEATSGNTGIGLAVVAASRGYKLVLVMPETMSEERKMLLAAMGAKLHLTPGEQGMNGSIELTEKLLAQHREWHLPDQFNNPANPQVHYDTTAVELWQQTEGNIDIFVAGVGTGGTITGVGRFLKSRTPSIKVVAVEPARSPVISGGKSGPHKIQGIGAGFIPPLLHQSVLDDVVTVDDKDAFLASRQLAEEQGIYTGISSGAALYAAKQLAQRQPRGTRIVTLLPDVGERYLSMAPYFRLDFR